MNIYTKRVSLYELKLYKIAANGNCVPQIIEIVPINDKYDLITERYPDTLFDLFHNKSRTEELKVALNYSKDVLAELHKLDILHDDISEENIVYNANTRKIIFIDFDMSKKISKLRDIDVNYYQDLFYESIHYAGDQSPTIDYVLRLKYGCIDFLLAHIK